uniref:Globin family profile domain-containing protein n=1 Tax=Romanomermis culicivorax TaxID=13658 RepID=A0A915KZ34_ROMCU
MNALTKEQIKLIGYSWKKDDFDWLFKIGMAIYDRIFELAPQTKQLFPYVVQAEKAGHNIRECPGFRKQALRFVQAISGILSIIDNPDLVDVAAVKRKLRSIGHR